MSASVEASDTAVIGDLAAIGGGERAEPASPIAPSPLLTSSGSGERSTRAGGGVLEAFGGAEGTEPASASTRSSRQTRGGSVEASDTAAIGDLDALGGVERPELASPIAPTRHKTTSGSAEASTTARTGDLDDPMWHLPGLPEATVVPPNRGGVTDDPATGPLDRPAARSRIGRALRRGLPAGWRGARMDPGRPGAVILALVAAIAAVLAAVGVWMDRPQAEPVAGLPAVTVDEPVAADASDDLTAATGSQPASGPMVVSVSGKVARPGLVQVPGGARVADAVAAAGGALPGTDLSDLNLARRLADGEQVAVGVPQAPDAAGDVTVETSPGATPGQAPATKVDLNTATEAQLDALPGVGPVTAQRIIEWRVRNGRFSKVEQLREVDGIGERRFAQLRPLVTV